MTSSYSDDQSGSGGSGGAPPPDQFPASMNPAVEVIRQGDADSDDGSSKGKKKGKKGSKGSKASKGKGKVKKQKSTIAVLPKTDPDGIYSDLMRNFYNTFGYDATVTRVLDVYNSSTFGKFEKYEEKLAKKRKALRRNGMLTKRMFHGTLFECDLGLEDDKLTPCASKTCRACRIIEDGFSLDDAGNGGRNHPDLVGAAFPARFGPGLYFCPEAHPCYEYSNCHPSEPGKKGLTALLVCQVAVGRAERLFEMAPDKSGPEDGCDSVQGDTPDETHPLGTLTNTEVAVYDSNAAVVTQVVLLRHGKTLCPNCGIQCYFDNATPVTGAYGVFCSDACQTTFNASFSKTEEKMRVTPKLDDPTTHPMWAQTNSPDNCVLVDLFLESREAAVVAAILHSTMPSAEIVRIYRVQNSYLFEKYYQEKDRIERKNGDANELLLWHGTSSTDPSEVYDTEEGFDFRYSSWGMWGTGSYFAVNASYSHNYSFTEGGYNQMFLAKVIAGDAADIPSDSSLKMPPQKDADETKKAQVVAGATTDSSSSEDDAANCSAAGTCVDVKFKRTRYDSVTGITNGSRIYVTYAPAKAYPAYLVTYKR